MEGFLNGGEIDDSMWDQPVVSGDELLHNILNSIAVIKEHLEDGDTQFVTTFDVLVQLKEAGFNSEKYQTAKITVMPDLVDLAIAISNGSTAIVQKKYEKILQIGVVFWDKHKNQLLLDESERENVLVELKENLKWIINGNLQNKGNIIDCADDVSAIVSYS